MTSGRKKIEKISNILDILVKICAKIPKKLLLKLFQSCRMMKGKKGILIRYIILKNIAKECGNNVSIQPNVYILNPQNLVIGDNVSIHPMCYLEAFGGINIGNNVSIAHLTSILSVNHTWEDKSIPIKYNEIKEQKVIINDDVWIGCGVRILSGSIICQRSIIAAGAVVTKKVRNNVIVAGVPAQEIKKI